MRFLKDGLWLLVIIFLVSACAGEGEEVETNSSQSQELTEADHIKQASFIDMQGDTVRTSDFEGKVVLIDFWETWCKPCLAFFPTMQQLQEEYPDDFAVLAVNPEFADSEEDAQQFIASHDYEFTYLLDKNNLSEKLGVQSIPFKVYVDADGNFIKTSVGSYGADKDYKELKSIIEAHKDTLSGE